MGNTHLMKGYGCYEILIKTYFRDRTSTCPIGEAVFLTNDKQYESYKIEYDNEFYGLGEEEEEEEDEEEDWEDPADNDYVGLHEQFEKDGIAVDEQLEAGSKKVVDLDAIQDRAAFKLKTAVEQFTVKTDITPKSDKKLETEGKELSKIKLKKTSRVYVAKKEVKNAVNLDSHPIQKTEIPKLKTKLSVTNKVFVPASRKGEKREEGKLSMIDVMKTSNCMEDEEECNAGNGNSSMISDSAQMVTKPSTDSEIETNQTDIKGGAVGKLRKTYDCMYKHFDKMINSVIKDNNEKAPSLIESMKTKSKLSKIQQEDDKHMV